MNITNRFWTIPIDNVEAAKEVREYIKGLYSVIKESDAYIRFALLTGVSKFSKAILLPQKTGQVNGNRHWRKVSNS